MAFLHHQNQHASTGQRLTGFARYTEVLERNIRKYLFTNLMTILGFLPFAIGSVYAILSSSLLVMLFAGIIGGIFAGPALSRMPDAIFGMQSQGASVIIHMPCGRTGGRPFCPASYSASCSVSISLWLCCSGGLLPFPDGEPSRSIYSVS